MFSSYLHITRCGSKGHFIIWLRKVVVPTTILVLPSCQYPAHIRHCPWENFFFLSMFFSISSSCLPYFCLSALYRNRIAWFGSEKWLSLLPHWFFHLASTLRKFLSSWVRCSIFLLVAYHTSACLPCIGTELHDVLLQLCLVPCPIAPYLVLSYFISLVMPWNLPHIFQISILVQYTPCIEPFTGHESLVCLETVLDIASWS